MYHNLKSEHYLNGDSDIKRILSTKSEIGKLISLTNENNFNMKFLNSSGSNIYNGIFNKAKKDNKSMWLLKSQTFDTGYVPPFEDINVVNRNQQGGGGQRNPNAIYNYETNREIDYNKQAEFDIETAIPDHPQALTQMFDYYLQKMETLQQQVNEPALTQWIQQAKTARQGNEFLPAQRPNWQLLHQALLRHGFQSQGQRKYRKLATTTGSTKQPFETYTFRKYVQ